MMKRLWALVIFLVVPCVLISCEILQVSQDTYISQSHPNTNYRHQARLKVGDQQQNAALLRFRPPDSIPDNLDISSAELQVYVLDGSGGSVIIGAYAMFRDSNPDEATWNHARSGESWGIPGCNDTATDRRSRPEDTVTVTGWPEWYSFDVTFLLREWLNAVLPNNGILLRQSMSSGACVSLASSDYGDSDYWPVLSFSATTPTPGGQTRTPWPTSTASRTATLTRMPTRTPVPSSTPTNTLTSTVAPQSTPTSTATLTSLPTPEQRWSYSLYLPLIAYD